MGNKYWKLLVALFVLTASQAVFFVGVMLGASAGFIGVFSVCAGLIGIVVGIIMGVSTIIHSRGRSGED